MRAWSTVVFLILFSLTVTPVSASIVNYGLVPPPVQDGAIAVLTFSGAGTDAGCAYWDGSTTVLGGPNCPGPITLGQANLSSGATTTFGAAGVANTRSLAILFVPDEPTAESKRDIQVDYLVLALQNPSTGAVFFSATLPTPYLAAGAGHNQDAYIFSFDWDQSVAAQQAVGLSGLLFSDVRLSIGAQVSLVDGGGNQVFYLANINDIVPTPEPATFVLIGAGLLALGLLRRRK